MGARRRRPASGRSTSWASPSWRPWPPPEGLLPPPRSRTRAISLRLDEDLLRRLKAMARRKGKGYQTLLKEFVLERLYEEEKREGFI